MICPTCGVEITSDKVYWLHVEQCVEPEIIEIKEETPTTTTTVIPETDTPTVETPTIATTNLFGGTNLFTT